MALIQQLSTHVADLIAAGEVVERPASVVKELVENAIDAGSSAIVVEIQNGGMTYIRISDNGCGIAAEELPTAFLRHATSKLRQEEDLAAIGTLGFRGEALAAIAAVSHVDIISRRAEAASGASLHLDGGVPGETAAIGAPQGTTILVRDLFYNTPARLKFMKKDTAEASAIGSIVQHLALSHPHISFRLLKDGAEALLTPGDGQLASAIYAALGREFSQGLTPLHSESGSFQVDGFVTKPLAGRGTRGMQVFFVNGRYIKSQLLSAALEEAYRNQLLKGKYPGCVLHLTLPAGEVDVNVHPAKTVVKFLNERAAFDAVYYPVLDALSPKPAAQAAPLSQAAPATERAVMNPRQDFYQTMSAQEYQKKHGSGSATAQVSGFQSRIPPVSFSEQASPRMLRDSVAAASYHVPAPTQEMEHRSVAAPLPQREEPTPPELPPQATEEPAQQALSQPETLPWRIVGEVLETYIVCEDPASQTLWLIDKHAAHERVLFDRLQAQTQPIMSQALLSPVAVTLAREEYSAVLEHLPLFSQLGFACEDFGDGSILVREIPCDIDPGEVTSTLEELAGKLLLGQDPAARREQLLHTMACKAAIKAGMHSDVQELQVLVEKVQRDEIRYCPHGRPVAAKLTRYELEKMFKRA